LFEHDLFGKPLALFRIMLGVRVNPRKQWPGQVRMSHDGLGPVAEWRRRESGATLFILVQIQAGSPAFAASQLRLGKPAVAKAAPP
jgi:hypothetical protein